MKIATLLLVLLLASVGSNGVARAETIVSSSDLLADAAVLHDAYEQLHPGLLRYATPDQVEQRYAALRAAFARDRSLGDAFLAFTRFTASIECGHSYPNFYNQPASVVRDLFSGQTRVPFYFEWIARRMIVTRNFSNDPRLVPGSEIVRLNGVAASKILTAMLPLARADGSNDAKRIAELGVRGDDRYEAFDIYYPLMFPQPDAAAAVEVRTPSGATFSTTLPTLTPEQRIAPIAAKLAAAHGGASPLWSFRMLDARTGYLPMPTWETYNSTWDWKADITRTFAALDAAHAQRLIIDLRGNEGGTDVGNEIIAHLVDAPLHLDAYRRLVRYRRVPDALHPFLDTWDSSFYDWGAQATAYDDRFYRLVKYDDDANGDVIAPRAPRFTGTVEVLVDASNSSATFQFEDAVQRNHLATLVGTPTGGNQRGINGGAFFFVRLPHSHIEVDLPLIGTFPVQPLPDAGLTPDVLVETTPDDIARGIDPQLRAATRVP